MSDNNITPSIDDLRTEYNRHTENLRSEGMVANGKPYTPMAPIGEMSEQAERDHLIVMNSFYTRREAGELIPAATYKPFPPVPAFRGK